LGLYSYAANSEQDASRKSMALTMKPVWTFEVRRGSLQENARPAAGLRLVGSIGERPGNLLG
jgi:hypothetical protein